MLDLNNSNDETNLFFLGITYHFWQQEYLDLLWAKNVFPKKSATYARASASNRWHHSCAERILRWSCITLGGKLVPDGYV
jgi:hypothetical protein